MRYLVTGIAICAALALIFASALMNFTFWSEQGRSALEGQIFGGVSVALDLFKAILPLFIAFAFVARRWLYAGLASVAFVMFLASGLLAAIGFTALNRGHVTDGREGLTARHELAKKELSELDQRVSRLTGYPPIGTIEANINALKQDRRWRSTKGCTDATLSNSRIFCEGYFGERAKLSSAIEANRLEKRRHELRREVNRLRDAGAGEAADPQASLLARLMPGFEVSGVQLALVVLFAVLVEFGAAFGLFLATRHSASPRLASRMTSSEVRGEPVILEPEKEPIAVIPPKRRVLGPMAKRIQPKQPLRFVLDQHGEAFMAGR